MLKKIITTLAIAGLVNFSSQAQEERDLNKEVKVVSTYQPKINKANRIAELPVVTDTTSFTPSFTYFVQTKPLAIGFSPEGIPAAKIVGEPLGKINSHALTLAGGNYSTLLGDYRFNNQRSKTTNIGFHLRHYSTTGKLKLENGDKEKPDWKEQLAEVYGTTYLDEGKLTGRLFYARKAYNYYGFPKEDDVNASWIDLYAYEKQKQNRFGLEADFQSSFKDEEQINFGVGLRYEHFSDDINLKENDIKLNANAKVRRGDGFWSLNSIIDYFGIEGLWDWEDTNRVSKRKTLVWSLQPQYLLQTGKLNLKLGINTMLLAGDDSDARIYPDVRIDFEAINKIIALFAGVDGGLQMNRFAAIAAENPFVFSGLNVAPSNQQYRLFGGMKGSLSSNSSFVLSAEYLSVKDQYFFVKAYEAENPADLSPFQAYSNKFGVLYDDINLLRLAAEVTIAWAEQLEINSIIRYNHYTTDKLKEAWHKPAFELSANALYRFTDDIDFRAGVNMMGKRPVLVQSQKKDLDVVYDVYIGADYRFTENFTAFARVNNLFANKYYQWEGYPSQRLNALLGLKFVF